MTVRPQLPASAAAALLYGGSQVLRNRWSYLIRAAPAVPGVSAGYRASRATVSCSTFSLHNSPHKAIRSAVDLAEHNIERTEDRADVGQHVPVGQEVHRLQMGK